MQSFDIQCLVGGRDGQNYNRRSRKNKVAIGRGKKKIVKKIRPDKCVDHFVTLQGEQN